VPGCLINYREQLKVLETTRPDPHVNGALNSGCDGCPDIWELDKSDFAISGIDITTAAIAKLPPTAGCGPDERIVRLPRNFLVNAKRDIPDRL